MGTLYIIRPLKEQAEKFGLFFIRKNGEGETVHDLLEKINSKDLIKYLKVSFIL